MSTHNKIEDEFTDAANPDTGNPHSRQVIRLLRRYRDGLCAFCNRRRKGKSNRCGSHIKQQRIEAAIRRKKKNSLTRNSPRATT